MPESDQNAAQLRRDAMDYWESDGIPDIVTGATLTVLAGSAFLLRLVPGQPTGNWGWLIGSLAVGWVPAAIVYLVWFYNSHEEFIERFKTRFTYPRTGYVAPPSYWTAIPQQSGTLARSLARPRVLQPIYRARFLFTLALIIMTIFPVPFYERFTKWGWVTWGIIQIFLLLRGAPAAISSHKRKLARNKLYWVDILFWPAFWGCLALLVVEHDFAIALYIFILGPGCFMILKGAVFFVWYLHRHPLPRV